MGDRPPQTTMAKLRSCYLQILERASRSDRGKYHKLRTVHRGRNAGGVAADAAGTVKFFRFNAARLESELVVVAGANICSLLLLPERLLFLWRFPSH